MFVICKELGLRRPLAGAHTSNLSLVCQYILRSCKCIGIQVVDSVSLQDYITFDWIL